MATGKWSDGWGEPHGRWSPYRNICIEIYVLNHRHEPYQISYNIYIYRIYVMYNAECRAGVSTNRTPLIYTTSHQVCGQYTKSTNLLIGHCEPFLKFSCSYNSPKGVCDFQGVFSSTKVVLHNKKIVLVGTTVVLIIRWGLEVTVAKYGQFYTHLT